MDQTAAPAPQILIESLLAFWADAGVDCLYQDEAIDRIAAGLTLPPRRAEPSPAPMTAAAAGPASADAAKVQADDAIVLARRLAAEAKDLTELAAAIAAFEGCGLRYAGAARQAVFNRGPSDAPVMIIGEGPGEEEDVRGEPFVGRAGQLLDRMIAAAGLTDRVFITNTVFWRPPGNRTPTPEEQKVCAPFVERAIELVSPKILLLLGAASAKAMLKREEGILAMRGRWFEWRSTDESLELPAMPTLHPAFLLRQPAAKKKAWSDLVSLVQRLDRPDRPH
ncbi:uracil-DNA glycosylase family protein [Phenylobacterium sp.]|uniref:uracil-DNA glycosylase n=1 Tax=Phenylobacterium sp. TaxID=1871053 RepID=UPI0027316334|nr:uracil-DNA glycosylase [Phenylobacterium sp.]MDP1619070.1 uracil-DNA glycosylase [Phenylobacterium sp.]MDP1987737.1 uracil-DNA glycosylase [Phenylobacterium sp.]